MMAEFATRVVMAMAGTELGMMANVGDEVTAAISMKLERAGLRVYRSFDLRSTRHVTGACACPYHGTDACDCQMVILLVYQEESSPATVVLHGHQGRTWISLAETPTEELESAITAALASGFLNDDNISPVQNGGHSLDSTA